MNKTDRRRFLRDVAALGAVNLIPARLLWGATAPSNQLTRALIGFGDCRGTAEGLVVGL